jgi:hypothetical protein
VSNKKISCNLAKQKEIPYTVTKIRPRFYATRITTRSAVAELDEVRWGNTILGLLDPTDEAHSAFAITQC